LQWSRIVTEPKNAAFGIENPEISGSRTLPDATGCELTWEENTRLM